MIRRAHALVAEDQIEVGLGEVLREADFDTDLRRKVGEYQARLARILTDERAGKLSAREARLLRNQVKVAVVELLDSLSAPTIVSAGQDESGQTGAPTVFLSYAHDDDATAVRLAEALRAHRVEVSIDREAMRPGEDIRAFIARSVRDTDATVFLVSRASLLSPWVAMETVNTVTHEQWAGRKKLIACYLDNDFFAADFRLEATQAIDSKIAEIDGLLPRYAEERLDSTDLNDEKSRLYELRNQLGGILQRLKGSLCLDARGPELKRSAAAIARDLGPR